MGTIDFRIDPATLNHVDRAALMIDDDYTRQLALGIMRKVRALLACGAYKPGSNVNAPRSIIDLKMRDREALVDYLEGELIAVELPTGYTACFILRWQRQAEEFVICDAPSE